MAADGSTYVFDVNGDGFPDVASVSDEVGPRDAVNDGAGRFAVQKMPFRFAAGLLADVERDGRIDIVGLVPPFTPMLNRGRAGTNGRPYAPGTPVPRADAGDDRAADGDTRERA